MSAGSRFNYDIFHLIFNYHDVVPSLITTQNTLLDLQLLCYSFYLVFRPFIYEHINLQNQTVENAFLTSATSSFFHRNLLRKTRTLQITLRPLSPMFEKLGEVLQTMTSLCTLNICYAHNDSKFIETLTTLNKQFPRTLKTLHLRPVLRETFLSDKVGTLSYGPWVNPKWSQLLCQLKHFRSLVVTTPTHLIWPANQQRLDSVINHWTKDMSGSSLESIQFYYAYCGEKSLASHHIERRERSLQVPDMVRKGGRGRGARVKEDDDNESEASEEDDDDESEEYESEEDDFDDPACAYENVRRFLPAGMDLDPTFGVRTFLKKTAGEWAITTEREYGLENYTFFGLDGGEICLPYVVAYDVEYSTSMGNQLKAREDEQKRYPHMRSMWRRRYLYF